MSRAALAVLSVIYWAVALALAFLALGAPCGLVPDESCELRGPTLLGSVLGAIGPIGTLLVAGLIFYGLVLLSARLLRSK